VTVGDGRVFLSAAPKLGLPPSASGRPFHASNRTAILELDPDREIVAVDIKSDIHVLRMQIRTGRIVEASDFATGQYETTNGVTVARPAFKPIPKVDCAEFVFVGSIDAIVAMATMET
jgi:hypothetical protein